MGAEQEFLQTGSEVAISTASMAVFTKAYLTIFILISVYPTVGKFAWEALSRAVRVNEMQMIPRVQIQARF